MKHKILAILVCFVIFFSGCTKCSTCTCTKDGIETIEEECSRGINQNLDDWERYIMDEKGYDSCTCVQL